MIPLTIHPDPDHRWGYRCLSDPAHVVLANWLERDVGSGGAGSETELFNELSMVLAGTKQRVVLAGDEHSVTLDAREGGVATVASIVPGVLPVRVSFVELEDAVMRWFKVVDPAIAAQLLEIQRRRAQPNGRMS